MTIDVLIVDDDELIRVGLRAIVDAQPDLRVVGEAADGAQVPPLVAKLRPRVVLMDVRMPAIDGIQATRRLLAASADPPRVLVVTTFANDEYVYDALRAGASGFLLKDARPEELIDAIRRTHRGESLFAPSILTRLVAHYVAAPRPDRPTPALRRLTVREVEVLTLIGGGMSNDEIATALTISVKTVKTHITHLMAKLAARDRAQLVIAAFDAGLVRPRP